VNNHEYYHSNDAHSSDIMINLNWVVYNFMLIYFCCKFSADFSR